MPRKLRIILWVAIGLTVATLPVILSGLHFPFTPFFALISACGILIVYWTKKTITPVVLKRYLLLAGASAIGILFFHGLHFLVEELMIMGLFVCPIALIVGAALALKFKSTPVS
jgi:hypothetical protein